MQRAKRAKYSRTYASYFQNDDIYARQFKYFYDRKVTKYFNHIWHENSKSSSKLDIFISNAERLKKSDLHEDEKLKPYFVTTWIFCYH